MDELKELYQQVILDHNRNPRNFGALENHTHTAEGFNPLCGDHFFVDLILENNLVKEIHFHGQGCALSKASASIMTTLLKGKTLEEAGKLFEKFHDLVTGKTESITTVEEYGKIAVFSGVREFPVRVKCASLAWHTMKAAISIDGKVVSTE